MVIAKFGWIFSWMMATLATSQKKRSSAYLGLVCFQCHHYPPDKDQPTHKPMQSFHCASSLQSTKLVNRMVVSVSQSVNSWFLMYYLSQYTILTVFSYSISNGAQYAILQKNIIFTSKFSYLLFWQPHP